MPILDRSQRLKKQMGLPQAFAISMGAMLSSGFFLLPGLAAAKTGPSVIVAYLAAGLLMVPAMLCKAELATAMPRAGGDYYFLDRSMGPLMGTVGGLGTWLVMSLKSAFALVGMGAYLSLYLDLPIQVLAVGLTAVLAMLNVTGVRQTTGVQVVLVSFVLAVMALFLLDGFETLAKIETREVLESQLSPFFAHGARGFFAAVGLVVISYAGLTKIASVAEEIEEPEKNIPRAMFLSLTTATLLYVAGVTLMVAFLDPSEFRGDLTPVATAAGQLMDWLPSRIGLALVVAAAVAGFSAAGNAALLSASRFPFAMARDNLLPRRLAHLSRHFGTPVVSVVLTAGFMIFFIVVLTEEGIAKLASSMALLIFGLVCLAVIVMRESRLGSYDPGYRSPWYPWMPLAGIGISGWLIVEIGIGATLFTVGVVAFGVLWFLAYARRRVHRRGALLHVFERLGRHRFEGLDQELRSIMKEKGPRDEDPFDEVVADAGFLEAGPEAVFDDVVREVSRLLAHRTGRRQDELAEGFREGTRVGATPVSHGVALPHTRVEGLDHPRMVLVRSRSGLEVPGRPGGDQRVQTVHALFFLASPEDDPTRHLRLLAHLASRVDEDGFLDEWLEASHQAKLKEVLIRDERYLLLRLEPGSPAAELAGRALRDLDLPHGCLIALVRRPPEGTLIPDGDTMLRLGDRVTVIGEPERIRELSALYHP